MLRTLTSKAIYAGAVVAMAVSMSVAGAIATTGAAYADSCWNHNGSTMRLKASGNSRWFYYENPRSVLRRAGVRRGTLLFKGSNNGGYYSGTTRVFSKYCPGNPLKYHAEGPVSNGQKRVVIHGTRDVYAAGCRNTGRRKTDRLVFTYIEQC